MRLFHILALAATSVAAFELPFHTNGRYIEDATNSVVTYAGANWPGAADTMLPEGLQYQSISSIVSKIKSLGMNVIRLTYAIEMVDQIYENGGTDIPIKTSLINALGQTNGTAIFNDIVRNNPSFNSATTRLQVFDAIAAETASNGIYVHLDNHVSKAIWCCSETDGNAWWGDTYFSAANWTRGIGYMASHGSKWTNLASMSLRNEPREPADDSSLDSSEYDWEYWYQWVKEGVSAIHQNNPAVLIFLSGLNYDTFLTPVVQGTALTPGTGTFKMSDFSSSAGKLVLELHNYENTVSSCSSLEGSLYEDGFQALNASDHDTANLFPVVLTEWGFLQDSTTWQGVYASCLQQYLPAQKAGWMIWVISGSYYIRSGIQDYDETWGLLTHDWSEWRSPNFVNDGLIPMVRNTVG